MSVYDPSPVVISFVSAPCGAGKTRSTCQHIAERAQFQNFLYVAPSKDLLKQTLGELQRLGVSAKIITSDSHPKRVKAEVIDFIRRARDQGEVLLITWSAFIDLPYFHRPEFWTVVIDEVPQVDRFYPLMLPFNHGFLIEHFELFPTSNEGISLVRPKNPGVLKRVLERAPDDVNEVFREISWDVASPKKEVFVDLESWLRVTQVREVSQEKSQNVVYFLSMLRPDQFSRFGDAIFLGANIEDSLLYHWFQKKGAKFKRQNQIAANLRSQHRDLGKRSTKVYYFAEDQNFSKTLAKKEAIGGGRIIDAMDRLAVETFAGEPFLYVPQQRQEVRDRECRPWGKDLEHRLSRSQCLSGLPQHLHLGRPEPGTEALQDAGGLRAGLGDGSQVYLWGGGLSGGHEDFSQEP